MRTAPSRHDARKAARGACGSRIHGEKQLDNIALCALYVVAHAFVERSAPYPRDARRVIENLAAWSAQPAALTRRYLISGGSLSHEGRHAAFELLREWTKNSSLIAHALSVEAAMRAYARKLGGDEEAWGIVGLLHDFDYERYPSHEDHPFRGVETLRELGYGEEILDAILGHAPYSGVARETAMAKALFAVDELCGMITAVALVRPSRRVADVTPRSVKKKMKATAFARNVNREHIITGAEELDVELDPHIQTCIEAMAEIAGEIGLGGEGQRAT